MTDAELILFNAGRRLFDDANEPVGTLLRDEVWPAEWLTLNERQAADKLLPYNRWKWFRKGWFEAAWEDAQPDASR